MPSSSDNNIISRDKLRASAATQAGDPDLASNPNSSDENIILCGLDIATDITAEEREAIKDFREFLVVKQKYGEDSQEFREAFKKLDEKWPS